MGHVTSYSVVQGRRVTQRQRLLVRRDPAVWPFVWRGLLPTLGLLLLGLYAVWPFAKGEIEANVNRSITKALMLRGLNDVAVRVSGQQVVLTGSLKPGVTALEAIQIARSATCPTWVGPQVCAELVIGQFDASVPAPTGVPALPSLPAASVRPDSARPRPAGAIATPAAPTATEREACEKALAAVVGTQRIEFATGSAVLVESSKTVLDRIVQAHQGCKGVVRIEGHTDDRGDPTINQNLSLARAEAVRTELLARGIPADRLVAEGFGASRPTADNATNEGRRQNRRIEFKVVAPR